MLKIFLAIVTVFLVISSCCGHIGGQISLQDIREIKPQKYCGPVLSKALALLCYVDNDKVGKRTEPNSIYDAILPPFYKEEDVAYWPWMSAEKARGMGLPSRGKRFVVDECCFKACSIDELMSYC